MKAICLICGVEFEKNAPNQKCCSLICYKQYKKKYGKEYRNSEKYKESRIKYLNSEKYKEKEKKYRKSETRKKYLNEYKKTDKYKESRKKHENSEKYKETRTKYLNSEKYKESQKKLRINLNDSYVKHKLNMFDAPKELIELKRVQLMIKRELNAV